MIQGVIFDLDGVLVSTDELHYRSWKRLTDREGIAFDHEINHRLRGVSRMESLEIVLERAPRAYSPEAKARLADEKNALFREFIQTLTPADLLPGVASTLAELRRRGTRRAVASSSRNARAILEQIRLTAEFDAIVDGNDIHRSKPDPEVFLLAAQRLGLAPSACLVIEDAQAGVAAARAAGMAVLAVGAAYDLPGVERRARDLAAIDIGELLAT